jgi:predicted kinase
MSRGLFWNFIKMPTIKILVGPPRSGKSTWTSQNKKESDVIVSADQLRLLVYNKRFWQERENEVWKIRAVILKMLIQQGKDIIIDETNLMVKRRKETIEIAKMAGYRVECIIFNGYDSVEELNNRAVNTGQSDLIGVIGRMLSMYQRPTIDEGFDSIVFIDEDGEMLK